MCSWCILPTTLPGAIPISTANPFTDEALQSPGTKNLAHERSRSFRPLVEGVVSPLIEVKKSPTF